MPGFTIHRPETKNDAKPPGGQCCVVKFHPEDGGVVLRIQLVIDAALSIELLGQYSITDGKGKSRGLYRSYIAIFEIFLPSHL